MRKQKNEIGDANKRDIINKNANKYWKRGEVKREEKSIQESEKKTRRNRRR